MKIFERKLSRFLPWKFGWDMNCHFRFVSSSYHCAWGTISTRRSDRKNAPYKPETELILGASYCPDILPHLCHSPSLPFNNDLVQWDPNHQYPETYNSIAPLQASWDWRASQGPATPSVDQTVAWGAFTPFSLLYLHWAQICIDFWCLPCPSQPLLVSFLTGTSLKRTLHL